MKLNPKQFKRFKELQAKIKAKKALPDEEAEFHELESIRNDRGTNDIQWWKNYPELLKDVVNIAFNWIPGTQVPITGYQNTTSELTLGVIAKATLRPSIGKSVSDADPFNAQIRQLWLDMHRKYRGIGTYEKSDLGIVILAIDGFFETLSKFERIYGVVNSYHIGNRVVPYGLKEALGIDDSIEENLADFRYGLNLAIAKAKQLCLPKGLSVLEADIVALANIFKDSADRRAFLFMFDQDLYALYNPTLFSTGGSVAYARYSTMMTGTTKQSRPAFTVSDMLGILNTQLSQLLGDDDVARMCSDLLAAYGPENVMTVNEVPENYVVEPVEDYERKVQFHNLTIVPGAGTIFSTSIVADASAANTVAANFPIVIYQENNVILNRLGNTDATPNYASTTDGFYPTVNDTGAQRGHYGKEGEIIFDTWVDNPGETEVMCGTRYSVLVSAPTAVATNVYRNEIDIMGTKVCVQLDTYSYDYTNQYSVNTWHGSLISAGVFGGVATAHLMQMDWHPTTYIVNSVGGLTLVGDIDNFARIDRNNLSRLHEVALLSGYKIPMISKE